VGIFSAYNGSTTRQYIREFIDQSTRSTQEVIQSESRAPRELLQKEMEANREILLKIYSHLVKPSDRQGEIFKRLPSSRRGSKTRRTS